MKNSHTKATFDQPRDIEVSRQRCEQVVRFSLNFKVACPHCNFINLYQSGTAEFLLRWRQFVGVCKNPECWGAFKMVRGGGQSDGHSQQTPEKREVTKNGKN